MNIKRNIEIEGFIRDYLSRNVGTDRLDSDFHDEFSELFGGKRLVYPFGSCPNLLAMKWLKKLYDQGILVRFRISLYGHELGFPNWVYSYTLSKKVDRR